MKKRRYLWVILIAALAVLGIGAGGVWWENRPLDLSKDEPPFNGMVLPPRGVSGVRDREVGDVWVTVVDQTGREVDFEFVNDALRGWSVSTSGCDPSGNDSSYFAFELKNPERAKEIALILMRRYGNMADNETAQTYEVLSGKGAWLKRFKEYIDSVFKR